MWNHVLAQKEENIYTSMVAISITRINICDREVDHGIPDDVLSKFGDKYLEFQNENTFPPMMLCQPYHLGADMFGFICRFHKHESLEKLLKDVAAAVWLQTSHGNPYVYCAKVGAISASSKNSAELLSDGYSQAKELELNLDDSEIVKTAVQFTYLPTTGKYKKHIEFVEELDNATFAKMQYVQALYKYQTMEKSDVKKET